MQAPTAISGGSSETPLQDLNPSNMVWFRFDTAGNNLIDFFGNCPTTALSGTTTHHDDELGWFTGSNGTTAGDRYALVDANETLDNILRTDDLVEGSLTIAFTTDVTNVIPNDNEHILTWGSSASGYYRIYNHSSAGGMSFEAYDGDLTRYNLFKGASAWGTGEHTWVMHYDASIGAWEILVDGEIVPGQYFRVENDPTYNNAEGTPPNDTRGLGLFVQHHNGSDNKIFGEDNLRTSKIADVMFIKRTKADMLISKFAKDYHTHHSTGFPYLRELAE